MAEDLERWLADLGLGKYAEAFAANSVDWDVLTDLSEKDLESLGLLLGDRKRLLRAIASLDGEAPPPARRMVDGAERRQITVMFVDLVGSTPLSERFDPEDMRELLQDFHALCAAAVEAQGGHVARYMGDGILVYFGYPQAHEDDAARAVHAGLGILENLRAANERPGAHDARLSVRIGIYTGLVVVGEVGAGPARDQDAITGETPNIANRVQTEAAADTIVIGDATQRLVDGQFDLEDLGPRRLKGVSNPIRLYRVLGESGAVDRFTLRARSRRAMTPLVGREAELEMVRRRWRQANDGEMRCVLLVGDAGIGKSRLLRALRDGLRGESYKFLPMFCTSNHANSAFWPVLDWFRRTLRLGVPSRAHTAAAMLGRMVKPLDLDMAEAMPILEAFLDLPGDESYRPADTAAPSFRRQLIDILVKMFGAMARANSLLFAVEDAHWIDPSTLELLQQLQEQLPVARLMLLITARPTFKPGWSYPQFVQINLDRLSRRERTVMVERLVGNRALPEPVLAEIVAKTDGIPLFVEELTKAVLEGGVLRESGAAYEVVGSLQGVAIPDTLQGSLMARLDRLDPEARELAQIGATIGREFSTSLLSRLAGRAEDELDAALTRLVAEEIVVPATTESFAGPSHMFRHVLIQEAAYQSLLLARRRQYHAAIAEAIEAHFPQIATVQPETIAHHWTSANRADEAIDWWRRAGERAIGRSAFKEACVHFHRGLELAERQPGDDRSRYRRALPLLLARGDAEFKSVTLPAQATYLECANIARRENLPSLMVEAAIRYADSEVYLAVSSAASVALLEEMLAVVGEDTLDRCRVLSRLAKALLSTGQTERGREVLREARQITARLNDRRSLYEVLVSDLMPNAGPPPCGAAVEERRQALAMIWEIAEGFESMRKLEALTRSSASYLEIADIDGFERGLHRQREIAQTSHADFDRWIVANGEAIYGIVLGTFAAAERSSLEALNALSSHDVDFPLGIHGMQMFTIRREQGRLAEVAPLVKRFVRENPDNAIWRPGLMLIASDLGFEAQARRTFEAMAESGFTLPLDSKRAVTLTYLAEVCARLGDNRRAAELHELLLPYRDLAVVVPVHGLCCGAAARYLGILATTMRDWPSAERHFESALATDEKMKAWPWLAHTRREYAAMLLARGRPQDKVRAEELRGMSLAAADRLGMVRLRQRLLGSEVLA